MPINVWFLNLESESHKLQKESSSVAISPMRRNLKKQTKKTFEFFEALNFEAGIQA